MTSSTSPSKPNSDDLLKIYKFKNSSDKVHGFLLKSTAPINVDDKKDIKIPPDCKVYSSMNDGINNIAKILADAEKPEIADAAKPEIVVRIHGYSTAEEDAIQSYHQTIDNIKGFQDNDSNKTFVFLGYRWPSESPNLNGILKTLPILLKNIFVVSLLSLVALIILIFVDEAKQFQRIFGKIPYFELETLNSWLLAPDYFVSKLQFSIWTRFNLYF